MDDILNKIFKAQNFTPNLWAEGNDIKLRNENGKTSWGYTDTITVHADSNNFLKFTVKDVIVVNHGGECYFENFPTAKIYRPQSITLSDSERFGTIKQTVQIEYKPRENLSIDTKELPEYGYNKWFVSLIYEIEVENIQTEEIYSLKSDNSYLWVSIPPEKMNEAEHCS